MAFGEYIPLGDIFPILYKYIPQTGNFTAGQLRESFSVELSGSRELNAAPLICYEDMKPDLTKELIQHSRFFENKEVNLFVNFTNDAWYGDSSAPRAHHLLALWRSIEFRKSMVRATNTGFTGLVDPRGVTISHLPKFKEGYLVDTLPLLEVSTLYERTGDLIAWIISLIVFPFSLILFARSKNR